MNRSVDAAAQQAFNDLIKNSDYLQSCLTAHRDATAEVIAALIGTIVAGAPALAPQLVVALKQISDTPGAPSTRGERGRIVEKILQILQGNS